MGTEISGKTVSYRPGREARHSHMSESLREMRGNQMTVNLIEGKKTQKSDYSWFSSEEYVRMVK